jgi:hypothetical protein
MNLHTGAVERSCGYLDGYQALLLKSLEYSIEGAILTPTTHASINGMPISKMFRQSSPFASLLKNIQNSVDDLQIILSNIASLPREAVSDTEILLFGYLHGQQYNQDIENNN